MGSSRQYYRAKKRNKRALVARIREARKAALAAATLARQKMSDDPNSVKQEDKTTAEATPEQAPKKTIIWQVFVHAPTPNKPPSNQLAAKKDGKKRSATKLSKEMSDEM